MSGHHGLGTVGQHQQRGQTVEAAREIAQHVEGGVVRPLHVVEDEHRRAGRAELGDGGVEHRLRTTAERPFEGAARARHGLLQRAEGTGREQVVADPDQHPHVAGELRHEPADEAGLADPGLAGHERGPAVPGPRPVQRGAQHAQVVAALEETGRHTRSMARSGRSAQGCSHYGCRPRTAVSSSGVVTGRSQTKPRQT